MLKFFKRCSLQNGILLTLINCSVSSQKQWTGRKISVFQEIVKKEMEDS